MTPVQIEFTGARSRRLTTLLWGVVVATLLLSFGHFAWWRTKQLAIDGELAVARARNVGAVVPKVPVSSVAPAWLTEANDDLHKDWNELFGGLEQLGLQGVRLMSLRADMRPGRIVADFEVDSWARVSELTAALNAADPNGRWRLRSVATASGGIAGNSLLLGVWER